jgi:hypothetical protein
MPGGPVTMKALANVDATGVRNAHVAGFSGGSIVAQELRVSTRRVS